jgi:heme/copper-type cytochrome/quinol oxidase subunit 1
MGPLVRRYLKTGMGFLLLGFGLGGWMLVRREIAGVYPSPYLISAHTHVILVGFVMMMILGVALWMFPRPAPNDPRYRPRLAELAYWIIGVTTLARFLGEVGRTTSDAAALRWLVALAGLGQVLGVAMFFYHLWPRIRSPGARARASMDVGG